MEFSLPIAKFCIEFIAKEDITFPMYAGSTFRGAFGHQLRKLCCTEEQCNCKGCSNFNNCPYAIIFEGGSSQHDELGKCSVDKPNPYIIEPLHIGEQIIRKNELFSINMVVFGDVIGYIQIIIKALANSGMVGFTKEQISADLYKIYQIVNNKRLVIFQPSITHYIHDIAESLVIDIPNQTSSVSITLETPTRIHFNRRPINQEEFCAEDFLMSLVRRVNSLFSVYYNKDNLFRYLPCYDELQNMSKRIEISNKDLNWFDWKRYSSRQQASIALGGLIGSFDLIGNAGDLSPFLPYIYVGQILHVGKSAVMGLGKFSVRL